MREDLLLTRKYLLFRYGEAFCKAIYNNPKDVSYRFYRAVFEGYEWNE